MNNKNTQLTLQDEIDYFEGEPCFEIFKASVIEFLSLLKIDITDTRFKENKEYNKIKDKPIFLMEHFMSYEEFIERFLIGESNIFNYYSTPFEIGSCEEIPVDRLNDEELYIEICEILYKSKEQQDEMISHQNDYENIEYVDIEDFKNYINSVIKRLKTHLNFDLTKYKNGTIQQKQEYYKILYFWYKLENFVYCEKKLGALFNKPSMENIDNSFIDEYTHNGHIIHYIKEVLAKEIPIDRKIYICSKLAYISSMWDNLIYKAQLLFDYLFDYGFEYTSVDIFKEHKSEFHLKNNSSHKIDNMSPIEELYTIISAYEYICKEKDIEYINDIQNINNSKEIPSELIAEMIKLSKKTIYIDIDNIDSINNFLKKNAHRLAKYIYLRESITNYDLRKIRECGVSFRNLYNCYRAFDHPLYSNLCQIDELSIISILQVILIDDQKETFKYNFYDHERKVSDNGKNGEKSAERRTSKKSIRKALMQDEHIPHALKLYLHRKTCDNWYMNVGKYDVRQYVRKIEKECDSIKEKIFMQTTIDNITEAHNFYWSLVDSSLKEIEESDFISSKQLKLQATLNFNRQGDCYNFMNIQFTSVNKIISLLKELGFEYDDKKCIIRYAFLNPSNYRTVLDSISTSIKNSLQSKEPYFGRKFKTNIPYDVVSVRFNFDYERKICKLEKY